MERFEGVISNCKKEVLTHTHGNTTIESKRNWILFWDMRVEGGGRVETTHEHYTDFEINDKVFRCYGDFMFKDGDKVSLYAVESSKGYYRVEWIKNFTRDFCVGESPIKPTDNTQMQPQSMFDVIIMCAIMGAMSGILVGVPVAFIAWGFYDAQFWKSFKITWLIVFVLFIAISPLLKPAKQQNDDKNKDDDTNDE